LNSAVIVGTILRNFTEFFILLVLNKLQQYGHAGFTSTHALPEVAFVSLSLQSPCADFFWVKYFSHPLSIPPPFHIHSVIYQKCYTISTTESVVKKHTENNLMHVTVILIQNQPVSQRRLELIFQPKSTQS
jgi:hypothetical protein